ncbi:MAG: thioredoxin family protein [Clostridia bacterium]|nr:thioredoxin family protein [Clostridia bacterium]
MKLKLLDFWAPWCGYCAFMEETIAKLGQKYEDIIEISRINIDDDKELSEKYQIFGVPTYILVSESGNILGRISGFQTEVAMEIFIENCLHIGDQNGDQYFNT